MSSCSDSYQESKSIGPDLSQNKGVIFNFNVMSKIMSDSIRTCLVSPLEFDKASKSLNSPNETLFNSLNYSDSDPNQCYKILKVLFSWYFSGYYTGRMEVLTQSNDK
eukprot:XP_764829.1 hypothetical protein [Theileria parva strain Muguga]